MRRHEEKKLFSSCYWFLWYSLFFAPEKDHKHSFCVEFSVLFIIAVENKKSHMDRIWMRSDFDTTGKPIQLIFYRIKSAGIESTSLQLFRKPKIIEIGSRTKKLEPLKVGEKSKKSWIPQIFVLKKLVYWKNSVPENNKAHPRGPISDKSKQIQWL